MGGASHGDVRDELEKIRICGKLTKRQMAELHAIFGSRFASALKLVREGRVKKYVFRPSGRVQWVVAGNAKDYLIYEDAPYCHCEIFYFNITEGKAKACKHLIAQRIASQLGLYVLVEEGDELFESLMEEWRKGG